jgi:hypothetical protein
MDSPGGNHAGTKAMEAPGRDRDAGASAHRSNPRGSLLALNGNADTRLAVSKAVQDELSTIRADLQAALTKFVKDRHYGTAERMLVIVDRSLHNLIRDAVVLAPNPDEPTPSERSSPAGAVPDQRRP